MARVTVEDCIEKVNNRFDLVMLAAQRSRQISNGADLFVERNKDKNSVVSLREIAEEKLELATLEEQIITSLQKTNKVDEPSDEEVLALLNSQSTPIDQASEEGNAPQNIEEDMANKLFSNDGDGGLHSTMPNLDNVMNSPKFEDVDTDSLDD